MAHDRLTPCKYYVSKGVCTKGREAEYNGYCQKCDKYYPRAKVRHPNIKKQKLEKERRKYEY